MTNTVAPRAVAPELSIATATPEAVLPSMVSFALAKKAPRSSRPTTRAVPFSGHR